MCEVTVQSHRSNPNRSGKSSLRDWTRERTTSHYFLFDRRYYKIIRSKLAALFIQDIINVASLDKTEWDGDWFRCQTAYLEARDWSANEQKHLFKLLAEAEYLSIEKRGIPAARWVTIDRAKIDETTGNASTAVSGKKITRLVGEKPASKKTPTESNGKELCRRNETGAKMDGGLMDFPPAKPEPVLADYELTDRLHKALRDKGLTPANRYSRTAWAGWFARLRRDHPPAEIDEVLTWYTARLGDRYVPEAWSAKSFVAKYPAVRKAMARDAERNPDIQVSDAAYEIVRVLTDTVPWKHGVPPDLAKAVQLGLASMLVFRACLLDAKRSGIAAGFVTHLLRDHGFDDGFVEHWFRALAWVRGSLVPRHVPGPANPDFLRWGRGQADKYGDESDWDALMKEIGHAG